MPTLYKTPGVYIEEIVKLPPSIAPVETAIPVFIGYTEIAEDKKADDLNLKPWRITSMVEYEKHFGKPQNEEGIKVTIKEDKDKGVTTFANVADKDRSKHLMYYALQMFYFNAGEPYPCYIVSVGIYKDFGVALDGSDLLKGLGPLNKETEPTLLVFPEAQNLTIQDYKTLHDTALKHCADLKNPKNRFAVMDMHGGDGVYLSAEDTDLHQAVETFRNDGVGTDNLKYGAVYAPNLNANLNFAYDEAKTEVTVITDGNAGAPAKLDSLKSDDNQRYEQARAAIRAMGCNMPPSSTMAGIYATVDNSRGVWKAPANVSLKAVVQPTISISSQQQEDMNVDTTAGKSVNAIRTFLGKGTLIWGARTLAGNDNEWRYINVRRFFSFVEESTKRATSLFVFEPNDINTWVRVQAMIENFLTTLWRQGALQGVKPEHAFYVSVGLGKTMTALDILEGRMIIEIGMAAVRPAEFIILRFSHKMAES